MAIIKIIDDSSNQVFNNMKPLGFEQKTVGAAASALTVPDGAIYAIFQLEANNIRVRFDGTNPTAAIGFTWKTTDDGMLVMGREILLGIRVIRAGGADGTLNVAYFGKVQ